MHSVCLYMMTSRMEVISALFDLLMAIYLSPVVAPYKESFDTFFDANMNKQHSQWPWRSCNVTLMM